MIKEFGFSITEMFVEIRDPSETVQRADLLPSWGILKLWQNECSIQYLSNGKAVAESTFSIIEEASAWQVMIRYVFGVYVTVVAIVVQVPLTHLLETVMLKKRKYMNNVWCVKLLKHIRLIVIKYKNSFSQLHFKPS